MRGVALMTALWVLCLVLSGVLLAQPADQFAIPPGMESHISATLTPDPGVLPEGGKVAGIAIEGATLRVTLSQAQKTTEIRLYYGSENVTGGALECSRVDLIEVCAMDANLPQLQTAYIQWLSRPAGVGLLSKIWSKPVVQKLSRERTLAERIPNWLSPLAWVVLLFAGVFLARRPKCGLRLTAGTLLLLQAVMLFALWRTGAGTIFWLAALSLTALVALAAAWLNRGNTARPRATGWLACALGIQAVLIAWLPLLSHVQAALSLANFLFVLMGIAAVSAWGCRPDPQAPGVGSRLLLTAALWALGLFALHVGAAPGWVWAISLGLGVAAIVVLLLRAKRPESRHGWERLPGPGALLFICLVGFSAWYVIGFADGSARHLAPIFEWLGQPWLTDKHLRAVLMGTYYASLALAVPLAFGLAVWREKLPLISGLIAFFLGAALLGVGAGWPLWTQPGLVFPDTPWVVFVRVFEFADGRLGPPPYKHFLGAKFFASLIFSLFGKSPYAVSALNLGGLALLGGALALVVSRICRSYIAGMFSVMLAALYINAAGLAIDGWWFTGAAGLMLLTVYLTIFAARRKSVALTFAALLLMQLSLECRLETVVLFPLYFIIMAYHGYPFKWLSRLAAGIFGVNLLRMLVAVTATPIVGGGDVAASFPGYAQLLMILPLLLLLVPAGVCAVIGRQRRVGFVLLFWFVGMLAFYQLLLTAPGVKETLLILLPLFAVAGALLSRSLSPLPAFDYMLRAAAALALLAGVVVLNPSLPQALGEVTAGRLKLAADSDALLSQAPPDGVVVIEPVYLRLSGRAERGVPIQRGGTAVNDLRRQIGTRETYCIDSGERKSDSCCYFELDNPAIRDMDELLAIGQCWPAEWISTSQDVVAERNGLRLLKLHLR